MTEVADHAGIRIIPPIYFAAGLILGGVLELVFPSPHFHWIWMKLFGLAFMVSSFALALWAVLSFKRSGTSVDVRTSTDALVIQGPYRFSRNPLYLAPLMLYAGLALDFEIYWYLPIIPVMVVILYFFAIRLEEQYLQSKFGEVYTDYKKQVRRWI